MERYVDLHWNWDATLGWEEEGGVGYGRRGEGTEVKKTGNELNKSYLYCPLYKYSQLNNF